MKKFFTVLLVIAVMFTFSFGSAFAFEAGTAPDTISDGYFENLWTDYVTADRDYDGFTISKSVLSGLKADAKVVYDDYMATAEAYVTTVDGLHTVLAGTTTKAKAYKLAAAAAQFAADKDAALAKFATVPTYNYSTEECTDAATIATIATFTGKKAEGKSYKEMAEMVIAKCEDMIKDADSFNADVAVANYMNASAFVKGVATNMLFAVAYEVGSTVSMTGTYDLALSYGNVPSGVDGGVSYVNQNALNLWSVEAIAAQKQVGAANAAAQKAANAAAYAGFIVGKDAATVAKADKWLKIADILAEEGEAVGAIAATLDTYAARADEITALEEYAARMGAEKNADGELIRDAAVVKAELEKGIVAIAKGTAGALDTAKNAIYQAVSAVVADKLAFVKKAAVVAAEDLKYAAEYFDAEYAKVEAKVAEYVAKIEAAEKIADVADIYNALVGKIAEIDTADVVRTKCISGAYKTAVDSLKSYADAYVTYADSNKSGDDLLDDSTLMNRIVEMVGESGLRTNAEIKKLTAEATAVAQGLPTVGAVKAAKKAVKAAVEAIPATVTVDSLALVQAAADAQDAYKELTTADSGYESAIAAAVTKLATAYNKSFVKAAATVDKKDEAAVKALLAEINDAIDALYGVGAEDSDVAYLDGLADTLEGYLEEIKTAERKAVEKAIKAIPINVTEAEKAVVQKARDLYDAYVAKYTDYDQYTTQAPLTGYAADDINISVLTAAETVLGLNIEDPALSVEALKITASSKATKGAITVKWTVKGDTSAVEGWEIWKSTKRNSGYSKAYTQVASKKTYKNTKGLKAGTRYYYKVRAIAYTADGVKVKSDWSNKAYRIAK